MSLYIYPGKEVLYQGRSWWVGKILHNGFWLERPGASVWMTSTSGLTEAGEY